MTMDLHVTRIIEQLSAAKNTIEVEEVIRESITNITEKKNGFVIQHCLNKLELALEGIPPVECNSEQWSAYRFALICIRNKAVSI